ncbi:MAG: TnpV protein [Clostridia bacterium]|nr:TnpV protein [Clostridia bacterium]
MKDNLNGVGIWGQRHYQYLKENKPRVIGVMLLKGTLNSYLKEVNEQADEMSFQLVKQLAKQEGITEELKRRDQMAWVGAMNNIRDRVNEIVLNEVVFA